MNEKFLAQVLAELQQGQADALGVLTSALCQQVDPKKFKEDIASFTAAYQKGTHTSVAVKLLQHAQAAAQAEAAIQANKPAGVRRPT